VTAGTIFDKTRIPLTSWFAAAWYVTSQQNGVSAMRLKQLLGLGSYQTAWTMLHKLRRAMVCPDRERLSCAVEVDETYIGGQTEKQAIVAIAVEVHEPHGFGRVRLRRMPDASASSLLPFVREAVEPGAEVRTNGWGGYSGLAKHGYIHNKTGFPRQATPLTCPCPQCTALRRFSSAGCWGPIRAQYVPLS
jgi:hypothetical protein